MLILPMTEKHIPSVAEIEKICFGNQWTATNFQRELENERCHYFVAEENGAVLGYLGYWQILEEAHITSVGVHPNYRKRHIAQELLCCMLDDCYQAGVNWITLEVKASNLPAQRLYQKFGFNVLGRRKNYYQAEKQDALIMWTEEITSPVYRDLLSRIKAELPVK